MSTYFKNDDRLYSTAGFGSPSGRPKAKSKKFEINLDDPDDCERLLKAIASGNSLTEAAPEHKRPGDKYQPVFRHPLPISDHSAFHDANLKRALCCTLEKQAVAAVTMGDAWVLEEVYMRGAPIDHVDTSGYSPIHLAVQVNNFECVMVLIKMGANVNAENLAGVTPLFLAVAASASETAQVLREAGAVMEVKNADEVAPMEILENSPKGKATNLQGNDLMKWSSIEMNYPGSNMF
jgi:ankyrin repeat protein